MDSNETPSYTTRTGGRRACYCKHTNTYSLKCCDGTLWAQGIGNITRAPVSTDVFLAQENGDLILQENNYNIIP
jgi:hypothetical protein